MIKTQYLRRPAVQSVPWTRGGAVGEEKAEEDQDDFHLGPVEGARAGIPGDALPRHLHEGRDRHEDRPD